MTTEPTDDLTAQPATGGGRSPQAPAWDCEFTVFTATYNSAHTLHRVHDSLARQTFRDFEWLIVDDGSTDDVASLVDAWRGQSDFPIRLLAQEHAGLNIAFNLGVRAAKGRFFLQLDADDACVPNALERFKHHWDSIPDEHRETFSAVSALCVDQHGRLVGNRYPHDVTDSDYNEVRYRYRIRGEKWGFHRTDVLRSHPFPELLRGQYLPEGVLWSRISRRYKTRFVNEPLRIYYIGHVSTVHGRTPRHSAPGGYIQHQTALNDEIDYFREAPIEFVRSAVHYVRFGLHCGTGLARQYRGLDNSLARLLWGVMLPVGVSIYLVDRLR